VIGLRVQARGLAIGGLDASTLGLEVPLTIVGIAGFLIALRRAPLLALSGGSWAAAAIILLAIHRPLWPHHGLVLMTPFALLGSAAVHLVQTARNRVPVAVMLLLALMLASVLQVHALQTPDSSRQPAVAALQRVSAPGDFVITDDQYTVALANRDTPPELVDTSKVRVLSGDLTTAELADAADRSHARAILVDDRYLSLSLLPGFHEWARGQFPVVKPLGHGRVLYLRRTHRPRRAPLEAVRADRPAGPVQRSDPGSGLPSVAHRDQAARSQRPSRRSR
jgi:hypothetical protein